MYCNAEISVFVIRKEDGSEVGKEEGGERERKKEGGGEREGERMKERERGRGREREREREREGERKRTEREIEGRGVRIMRSNVLTERSKNVIFLFCHTRTYICICRHLRQLESSYLQW